MAIEPSRPIRVARWIGWVLRTGLYRLYALALMGLIISLTWLAFSYLLGSMMDPLETPAVVADLPKRLDMPALTQGREDWSALQATLHPRSPLSHYHRLAGWIQTDLGNDCTSSGCHSPVPHFRRKEVRAFLNMHGTVMHCGVCHMTPPNHGEVALTWYDPQDGAPADSPAVLQASALAERMLGGTTSSQAQAEWLALLDRAVVQSRSNPDLVLLVRHARALPSESAQWTQFLNLAKETLVRHFRGEYGRKIAVAHPEGQPILGHPNTEVAKARLHRLEPDADPAEREAALAAVHPLRRPEPLACSSCHGQSGTMLPYAALGYPPTRLHDLQSQVIFTMIENIAAGQEFHLPTVLKRNDE